MADTKMSALPVAGALAGADIFAIAQGGVSKQASATQIAAFTGSGSVPTARLINTTSPLAGGGDLSADRTLSIADAVADGATKGAAAFLAADFNSAAGVISIDYVNGQAASAVNKGFLTAADFVTFSANAPPFTDTGAIIKGSGDPTKLLRFEVDGFTAGSTRVLTPPNLNCTIAGLQVSQTFSADQTFTPGNNVVPVTIGGNSVTGASTSSTLAINTTWNTTGAPDAIQLIVTDTASDPTSNLLDLMIGATSQFAVSKAGSVTQLGQLRITGAAALTQLIYASTNTTGTGLTIFEQASADTDGFDLHFRKARGTVAVPTVITTGDVLGTLGYRGYGGASGYVTAATIRADSTGTIADTRVSANLVFSLGTDAAPTVLTDRVRIHNTAITTFGLSTTANQIFINETTDGLVTPVNYSRLNLQTQAGNHLVRTEAAGTGTLRTLQVGTGPRNGADAAGTSTIIHGGQSTGTGLRGAILFQQSAPAGGSGSGVNALTTSWQIDTGGNFIAGSDATFDIGASAATRPRTGYFSGKLTVGAQTTAILAAVPSGITFTAATAIGFGSENTTASGAAAGAFLAVYSNDGAAMASGDRLGGLLIGGSSSATAVQNTALIAAFASQNWVDGAANGTRVAFFTTANGATARTEYLSIEQGGLITFQGQTTSFPALKRSSAELQVRLADDSAFGAFKCGAFSVDVGKVINIVSGTNQRAGNATLVAGTVTVSNTTVTANTIVLLTRKTSGGTPGTVITYTLSAGNSFTVTSDNALDTSTFSYLLIEVP